MHEAIESLNIFTPPKLLPPLDHVGIDFRDNTVDGFVGGVRPGIS